MNPVSTLDHKMEEGVLLSRYLLIPMYFGMTVGLCLYNITFFKELMELCVHPLSNTETDLLLGILNLMDMAMIANLILIITVGGYSIFIHEIHHQPGLRLPRFLHRLTTGSLKVKMGMSLIGVSSIHLLKSFVDAANVPWPTLAKQLIIHASFIVSALVMMLIEVRTHPPELEAKETENEKS